MYQNFSGRLLALVFSLAISLMITACGGGSDTPVSDPTPPAESVVSVEARVGTVVEVQTGQTATLDGSDSFWSSTEPFFTSSNANLTYQWSFLNKPFNSTATLSNATSTTPSFIADIAGDYMVELVVIYNGQPSERDIQIVVAVDDPTSIEHHHAGLSSNCQQCHNGDIDFDPNGDPDGRKINGKDGKHMGTSLRCEACHTTLSFASVSFVDHQEVFGVCSECHNGEIAIGKSDTHTLTNAECSDCHSTGGWFELGADGSFDHTGITGNCQNCHNGQAAIGKDAKTDPPHINTESDCVACHNTDGFTPAYGDHTDPDFIAPGCKSCHNGTDSVGVSDGHPVINDALDCNACHSIVTFSLNGDYNHSSVDASIQRCDSCHSDTTSIGALSTSASANHPDIGTTDCGWCHNTGNFADYTDHTGRTDNCVECHGNPATDPLQQASTYNANFHFAPIQDCSACHTPGTFTTGFLDHDNDIEVTSALSCESCHNDSLAMGKGVSHLDTAQDCGVCHTTTEFVPASWDHTGIIDNCASCHDGQISTGVHAGHIPQKGQDCSICHDINDFTSFAGITYQHQGIDTNNCAECHDTDLATPKSTNHIPSLSECSECHIDTTVPNGFQSSTFITTVHNTYTTGCEGCHLEFFFPDSPPLLYKDPAHLPTGQDCYVCHISTAFAPASNFSHSGIDSNCLSCHDGSTNNVNAGADGEPNDSLHAALDSDCSICHSTNAWTPESVDHSSSDVLAVRCDSCHNGNPITGKNTGHVSTTSDCSLCHNTTTFVGGFIDHNSSEVTSQRCDACHNGTDAIGVIDAVNHVPTTEDCDVCHTAGGSFIPSTFAHVGITDNCASCHDGTYAEGLSVGHVAIGANQDCSACHNTTSFAGAHFDHSGIVDNCVSCHEGTTAPGKEPPPGHVPTTQDCHVCHQTTGFLPATFSHAGIVDNCSSCHDAGLATPKSATHVATNEDCGVCHNTTTFTGAVFDHTGIVDNCVSCHDGSTAIGKADAVPTHLSTELDCYFCHTTATFADGGWIHDSSTAGQCDTCHDGTSATGKSGSHISTTEQCDICHSTNGWAPTSFSHDPNGNYPGDHNSRFNLTCQDCHGNTISSTIPWDYPDYAPTCAGCHANDYRASKDDHRGLENDLDCAQQCHSWESPEHSVGSREW